MSTDRDEKLHELEARLDALKHSREKANPQPALRDGDGHGAIGMAMRLGVEMVSAVVVGGVIGWFIDRWLETVPWFMIVFVLLGFVAGVMNVIRVIEGYGATVGFKPAEGAADEDDMDASGTAPEEDRINKG